MLVKPVSGRIPAAPAASTPPQRWRVLAAVCTLLSVLLLAVLSVLGARAQAPPAGAKANALGPVLETLVRSERAFSARSVEKGMKDAFLAYLDEDGVVFNPLPVNGRQVWTARDSVAGTLIWEPSYAEVSGAGDLGYTTGPWEFRRPGAAAPACGHFISVWRKRPDGAWRVALDLGTVHPRPERGVGSGDFTPGPASPVTATHALPAAAVSGLDSAYSRAAGAAGWASALTERATADVRFNRDGEAPAVGLAAARAALDSLDGEMTWRPSGSGVAASGDLAYSYGVAEHRATAGSSAPPDSGVYLHLWRQVAGSWKLALAVENPLPKHKGK